MEALAELVKGKDRQKAFRYLTAPPISEDDLKVLADASVTPKALRTDPEGAVRVRDTVLQVLDQHRFPWLAENTSPTKSQREAAVVASAALAAAKEVETRRRNTSKDLQEKQVKDLLRGMGYKEVSRRPIPLLTDAPQPGEFCGETTLAGTRADVVVRLPDRRIMPIECKVSNSAVNSYKRLVHDTGGKAATWYKQLGRAQIIPSAVLAGVYSTANLETAQNDLEVFLFWQHRLVDIRHFIESLK